MKSVGSRYAALLSVLTAALAAAAAFVPAASADDLYTVLGPVKMQEVGGSGKASFAAGTKATLVSMANGQSVFEIDHKRYQLPTDQASIYFEAGDTGAKFLLGEALARTRDARELTHPSCLTTPTAASEGCPRDRTPESAWNDDAARRTALLCPIEAVDVIARNSHGDFKEKCRNSAKPLAVIPGTKTWPTCAATPECSPEQSVLEHKLAKLRLENERLHCTGHARKKLEASSGKQCMVPFNQPITKIVVHQTDAPSTMGPNNIFNWHRDRGYDDISYHYIIAKDASGHWHVFEGRPRKYVGAHAGPGANDDSLGIAIAGCFRDGDPITPTSPCKSEEDRPPEEAVRLLTNLVAKLKKETLGPDGKPSIKEVLGHGQFRFARTHCHTNCPSPACQMIVNRLQERLFGGSP